MTETTYLIHIERTKRGNFVATIPLLPGCRPTAPTLEQTVEAARSAIDSHFKNLAAVGKPIPLEPDGTLPCDFQVMVSTPAATQTMQPTA